MLNSQTDPSWPDPTKVWWSPDSGPSGPNTSIKASWMVDYFNWLLQNYGSVTKVPTVIVFDKTLTWTDHLDVFKGLLPISSGQLSPNTYYFGIGSGTAIEGQTPEVLNYLVAVKVSDIDDFSNSIAGTPYACLSYLFKGWVSIGRTFTSNIPEIATGGSDTLGEPWSVQTQKFATDAASMQLTCSPAVDMPQTRFLQDFLKSTIGMKYSKNCCYSVTQAQNNSEFNTNWCASPGINLTIEGSPTCDELNNNYCLSLDMALTPEPDSWCTCYTSATNPSPLNSLIQDWMKDQDPNFKALLDARDEALKAFTDAQAAEAPLEKLESLHETFKAAELAVYTIDIASPVCYLPGCDSMAYQNGHMIRSASQGDSVCPNFCANILNVNNGPYSHTDIHGVCQQISCGGALPQALPAPGACQQPDAPPGAPPPGAPPGKTSWVLYGSIGVGVIVLLIIIFVMLSKQTGNT